jgi:hypothetical protein
MTSEEDLRLQQARERFCAPDFFGAYYGLDLDRDVALRKDYTFWMHGREREPFKDDRVDRWSFELFLQTRDLVSRKWMATQLGMKLNSLTQLLEKLDDLGPAFRYHKSDDLIGKNFGRQLEELIDDFQLRVPDSKKYMATLHRRVHEKLSVKIEPEFCATSQEVGDVEPEYGNYWDILTFKPISMKYQTWLSFGKWLTLQPDRCSILFYYRNLEIMRPFRAAFDDPEIPANVAQMLQRVAS